MREHYTKIHQLIGEDFDENLLLDKANAKAKQKSSTQKRDKGPILPEAIKTGQAETKVLPLHLTQRKVRVVNYYERLQNFVFPLVVKNGKSKVNIDK